VLHVTHMWQQVAVKRRQENLKHRSRICRVEGRSVSTITLVPVPIIVLSVHGRHEDRHMAASICFILAGGSSAGR